MTLIPAPLSRPVIIFSIRFSSATIEVLAVSSKYMSAYSPPLARAAFNILNGSKPLMRLIVFHLYFVFFCRLPQAPHLRRCLCRSSLRRTNKVRLIPRSSTPCIWSFFSNLLVLDYFFIRPQRLAYVYMSGDGLFLLASHEDLHFFYLREVEAERVEY